MIANFGTFTISSLIFKIDLSRWCPGGVEYREPYGTNNSPNSDSKIQINLLISSIVQIKLLSHAAMNGQKLIARLQSQRRVFATKHIASLGLQSLQPDRIKRRPFA